MIVPKVALVEADTSFKSYRYAKSNFYVYTYYLYKNLIKLDKSVEPLGTKVNPWLGKGFSILLDSFARDFSKYDIVHNLDLNPFFL